MQKQYFLQRFMQAGNYGTVAEVPNSSEMWEATVCDTVAKSSWSQTTILVMVRTVSKHKNGNH